MPDPMTPEDEHESIHGPDPMTREDPVSLLAQAVLDNIEYDEGLANGPCRYCQNLYQSDGHAFDCTVVVARAALAASYVDREVAVTGGVALRGQLAASPADGLDMPECILLHDHGRDEGECVFEDDPQAASPADGVGVDVERALVRLVRFTHCIMSSKPGGVCSFNDLRFADTVAGKSKPGEWGDESDPWPEQTAADVAALEGASDGTREERRIKTDPNVPQWEERRGRVAEIDPLDGGRNDR